MKTDWKLLFEQEPEFRAFCETVICDVMLKTPDGAELFKVIKSMYDIGNSASDTAKFLGQMMKGQS